MIDAQFDEPVTLSVDCGGTGLKATALDRAGVMLGDRVRFRTPYPCPPDLLVASVVRLAREVGLPFARASVGFPGLIRKGVVRATPHYVTTAGPFSAVDPVLLAEWRDFDVQHALGAALDVPTRVLNDAEIHGMACIQGRGFEVMMTLGTGLGCALFEDGRLLPKVELSQAPFRKKQTYDQQLGHHTRVRLGDERWTRRVRKALDGLRPFLWWDHLYLGGGGARHLQASMGPDVTVVPNAMGLLGGVKLWER